MMQPDVSVGVFASHEGRQLHACVESVVRAAARAERNGHTVELTLVLHDPSPGTLEWTEAYIRPPWRTLHLSVPRRSSARRSFVENIAGRSVSLIDASDLWSKNWLLAALAMYLKKPAVIWRPEFVLSCGPEYFLENGYGAVLQTHLANPTDVLGSNPYASSFLAPRDVLEKVPFPMTDEDRGWTDGDWWWTCETVEAGYSHRTVPGTALYRRPGRSAPPQRLRIGPSRLSEPGMQAEGRDS